MKPETSVTLSDKEFTLCELEDFIHDARRVDGIEHDALVTVTVKPLPYSSGNQYTLTASSAYRRKGD